MQRAVLLVLGPLISLMGCLILPTGLVATPSDLQPTRSPTQTSSLEFDAAEDPICVIQKRIRTISRDVGPAVVHISLLGPPAPPVQTSRPDLPEPYRHYFDGNPTERLEELGSGVVIDPTGLIVTNRHVIESGDEIIVRLTDGREFTAQLVGISRVHDLAVLRIDAGTLPAIKLASIDSVHTGLLVVAIGSPFGLERTITLGIVSAVRSNEEALPAESRMIQTDAAINPGNSGGPLVNLQGELVGLNTALISETGESRGIGFAIPVDVVKDEASRILSRGMRRPAWLGIVVGTVDGGLEVRAVMPSSPAAAMGLLAGDRIVGLNGQTIKDLEEFLRALEDVVGQMECALDIARGDQRIAIKGLAVGKPKDAPLREASDEVR